MALECLSSPYWTIPNSTIGIFSPLNPPPKREANRYAFRKDTHVRCWNVTADISVDGVVLEDVGLTLDSTVSFQHEDLDGKTFTETVPVDWCNEFAFRKGEEARCHWTRDWWGDDEEEPSVPEMLWVEALVMEDVFTSEK